MSLFSRPYLFCEREVTRYLRFNEGVADSQMLKGANLKYRVTAMPGGISLEIWPLEKTHTLTGAGPISFPKPYGE